MRYFPFSLRFSIPAILLFAGLLLGLFTFHQEVLEPHGYTEAEIRRDLEIVGHQSAEIVAYLYRTGDIEETEVFLGRMMGDPKLTLALLFDERDRLIASMPQEVQGPSTKETLAARSRRAFLEVRREKIGQMTFSPKGETLWALYPVSLETPTQTGNSSKIGILYLEYDLSDRKQKAYTHAGMRSLEILLGLTVLCAALWLFFDRTVTGRAARLVKASNRLAKGHLDSRVRLRGSDELAQIAVAFDRMADRIQQDTKKLQKSEEQFRSLVANIPGAIYRCAWDADWTMELIGDAIADISGYPASDFIDNRVRTFASIIHPEDRARVEQAVERGLGMRQPYKLEYRIIRADGRICWVYEKGQGVWNEEDELLCLDGAIFDISDRKHREKTLQSIVQGTATTTGQDFFHSCVRALSNILNVRYGMITEFAHPTQQRVRTLAFWQDEGLGQNFEYDLAGTPCEAVIGGEICYYPQNVQACFPRDRDLVELSVESYLGVPLVEATGRVIGHLAVMDTQPMNDKQHLETILRIFAARATAELQRQQTETLLREREAFLSSIYNGVEYSIFIVDVLADGDFRFVELNPTHERITGISTQQLRGKTPEQVLPAAAAASVRRHYQECVQAGTTISYEECLPFEGQETYWLTSLTPLRDSHDRIYRLVGTCINISDRVATERERERLLTILEASTDHIGMTDARGRVLWNNAQAKKILGFPPDADLSTLEIADFHPPWALEVVRDWGLPEATRTGIWIGETALLRADGSEMPVSQMIIAHKGAEGRVEYFSTIMRDISDRKAAEAELQEAKNVAEAANRAKSEFLARMSHELRTPLNAILGFAQVMVRDRALSSDHQQSLNIINRSGEHLLALINDVLEMSKIEAGRLKLDERNFDLYSLLDSLQEMLRFKALGKGLTLTFERSPRVPQSIVADESKLRQVLINLLGNAIEFTDRGSVTLRVAISHQEGSRGAEEAVFSQQSSVISHQGGSKGAEEAVFSQQSSVISHQGGSKGAEEAGETGTRGGGNIVGAGLANHPPEQKVAYQQNPPGLTPDRGVNTQGQITLYFEVEDTGCGIAPKELETLFEAFVQTETGRRSQKGTGLGLAISYRFVQFMGGELKVNSTLGRGSLFTFAIVTQLGQTTPDLLQRSQRRVKGLAPDQPTYRLLIVDDTWEHRQLLLQLLTPFGFEMREAENGREGLALWQSWQPHLIFMDMGMPVMNGHEATQQIKTTTKGQATPVIALTASAFENERTTMLLEGCDDFISKPFREEEIFERLSKHLGLRYIYEESTQQEVTARSLSPVRLTPKDLTAMPPEWVEQLHQAASACSEKRIGNLLEAIPSESTPLRIALTELAYNFRYDAIMELTAPGK